MTDLTGIIKELSTERDRLNAAITTLESLNNGTSRKTSSTKRTVSAASRAKMARAQRARWAKIKHQKG